MYTGLYLISRSRIVAYLDDIVKFGDDIYPNLQLTSNMSFLLQSRGRQQTAKVNHWFSLRSVHLALTKLVWSDSQTFWAWSIERT